MANVMLFSVIDVFADKKAQETGIILLLSATFLHRMAKNSGKTPDERGDFFV